MGRSSWGRVGERGQHRSHTARTARTTRTTRTTPARRDAAGGAGLPPWGAEGDEGASLHFPGVGEASSPDRALPRPPPGERGGRAHLAEQRLRRTGAGAPPAGLAAGVRRRRRRHGAAARPAFPPLSRRGLDLATRGAPRPAAAAAAPPGPGPGRGCDGGVQLAASSSCHQRFPGGASDGLGGGHGSGVRVSGAVSGTLAPPDPGASGSGAHVNGFSMVLRFLLWGYAFRAKLLVAVIIIALLRR